MNNKLDLQMLNDTIYDLKNNPNACTLYNGSTSENEEFTISESNPGEQLSKFINYFYENDLLDQMYPENYKKIENKAIDDYTYEETITALTKIIRGDRFISRQIYYCFKDKTLLKVVEKLRSFIVPNNE